MRLNFFKLGDVLRVDEINAVSTILMENEVDIKGHIKLEEDGYVGIFANYLLHYAEDTIAFREEDLVVKNPSETIMIECSSDFNCYYTIKFGQQQYVSNQQNQIVIPLSEFEVDDIIPNDFIVSIKYKKPYISAVDGSDGINLTSELEELIRVSEDNAIITLNENIVHDITEPIIINKNISLKSDTRITIQGSNHGQLFNISDAGKLIVDNIVFDGFKSDNVDGTIISNDGKLYLNNCAFTNSENRTNDGIIYNTGLMYSEGSVFLNCKSKNGGALFVTSK